MTRSSADGDFDRFIFSLNRDYGLRLVKPSKDASSPYIRFTRNQEACDIYNRLHAIHANGHERDLERVRTRFASEAEEISRQWILKQDIDAGVLPKISAPLGARSDEERTALHRCLSGLLDVLSRKPTKRLSNDNTSGPASKISRVSNVQTQHHDHILNRDIDDIPVRSKGSEWGESHPRALGNGHNLDQSQSRSDQANTSFTYASANTSKASLSFSVFSNHEAEDTPASSQFTQYTNRKSGLVTSSQDLGEDEASVNSFTSGSYEKDDSGHEDDQTFQIPEPQYHQVNSSHVSAVHDNEDSHGGLFDDINVDDDQTLNIQSLLEDERHHHKRRFSQDSDAFSFVSMTNEDADRLMLASSDDQEPSELEAFLRKAWPHFPTPYLDEAPLAVIWEVTRIAIHCGVDLRYFDLMFEPNSDWLKLSNLRNTISTHRLFIGKGLPERCDDASWEAALHGFKSHDKIVILSAELVYRKGNKETEEVFDLHLKPLRLSLGHRLDRRFGADRFLEIVLPSPTHEKQLPNRLKSMDNVADQIIHWLCKGVHPLLGRCWKPFFTKPAKKIVKDKIGPGKNDKKETVLQQEQVFFFATDGHHFRNPEVLGTLPPQSEAETLDLRTKLNYSDLLEWAIGLSRSGDQPALKLFSRVSLNLTRTYPTIILDRDQIIHKEEDIMSTPEKGQERKEMNDGMGKMSWGLARKIADHLDLPVTPSAFQGRLGSAKGMWLRDVENDGDENDIWIETYPSQRKWSCDFIDQNHRTFEVKSFSKPLKSASLNQQFIPILEARAFTKERKAAMRQQLAKHLSKSIEDDLAMHLGALNHPTETLLFVRQIRATSTAALNDGFVRFLGGLPNNDEDRAAFLIDSGFEANKMKYLGELLWGMWEEKSKRVRDKWSFEVPCSTNAYMAVDFSGVLQPGEVHLSFSSGFNVEGFSDTQLEDMDILVARAPAHFPTDIQKVRVVSKPKLRRLKDVIVFPSTGPIPLADLLSGGDYDGDRAWICWDPSIVNNFSNAGPSPKYDFLSDGFLRKQRQTFNDIKASCSQDTVRACNKFQLLGMSFSMQPSLLGICTKYKEKLCYHQGRVDSKEALILSNLLSDLVDQAKSGIEFTEKDWERFCKHLLNTSKFAYEKPEYSLDKSGTWHKRSPPHVLDYLKFQIANEKVDESSAKFFEALKGIPGVDRDLTGMYFDYLNRAKKSTSVKRLLTTLQNELRVLGDNWSASVGDNGYEARVQHFYSEWVKISPPDDLKNASKIRDLKLDWATTPRAAEVEGFKANAPVNDSWEAPFTPWSFLKASTTLYLYQNRQYSFAWLMAGKQLAMMKATVLANSPKLAQTSAVLSQPIMWAARKPDKAYIERMKKRRDAAMGEKVASLDEVTEYDEDGTVIDD